MLLRLGTSLALKYLQRLLPFVVFQPCKQSVGFMMPRRESLSPGGHLILHLYEDFSPSWCLDPLYMKKSHKSQRDPNPCRRINPGLNQEELTQVDSRGQILQIDRRRVDPIRPVEANPGIPFIGLIFRPYGQ